MSENATDLVYGLELGPLPDSHIPLEAIVIIKVLDDDGEPTLVIRQAGAITDWERIGMLSAALDIVKEQTADTWRRDLEDDDGDAADASDDDPE